ncbi:MAG: hypothetical protein WC416_03130 [Candidatus Omnitrophota bacterium]|jgi:hypothetical protein
MRADFISIALSLALFINTGVTYAGASLPKVDGEINTDKKAFEDFEATRKLIYEKMVKRTNEYKDELDNMFLLLNSFYRKAVEEKDAIKEKDLVAVMTDYNSVLGDIGVMQAILNLKKFAEGQEFMEYYEVMINSLERLRGNFSLKNEMFLSRIDKDLRNPDALRYEKRLCRMYREYFEYDPKIDKIEESEDFIKEQEKKLKEKGR